ncbi:hypothetical protein PV379_03330 [Streptomyces caniscabiei]|uniref:hypothetical protein n=1 Tax=Streptomyces caniscabiei TaxID=2746961 RepID=UPI0029A77845|nr:hypothetical protein [Streptomyces caniscabiei]MDX2776373.1 hypothetical protein [Streptomyces caniscabiei]
MQPERDPSDTQQPDSAQAQPVQTPVEPASAPVVTLTPDQPAVVIEQANPAPPQQPAQEPLHWQGTEYVHHEKDALWFVVFGIIVVAFMLLAIFLIKSPTFAVLIPVMAVALIVYARRPPRLIDYTLSPKGLYVNDQLYPFGDFKGFGVIHDGDEYSIMLIPTKRFRLGVSIYFPEDAGEAIVDMLGTRLPMREMKLDAFDRVIHKLRI